MTSLRSSVRPRSSKQPWGTILQPEFGMGHQKMTEYEVNQTVQRLYYVPETKHPTVLRPQQAELDAKGIAAMLDRLTKGSAQLAPDTKRTQKHSIYKEMGVVNSFAWKGYN